MKLHLTLLAGFLILFLSVPSFAQKKNRELEAIHKVIQKQQDDWNRADLMGFMQGYWKSDSLKFIGRNGINYGWQTTLENYQKGYPTPEAMGKLTFTILHLELISNDTAWMAGRYQLKRQHDEPSGFFTLLWKKINNQWVIVADHTS